MSRGAAPIVAPRCGILERNHGHRLSKIVTRTGDAGTTGLGDGSRVAKDCAADRGDRRRRRAQLDARRAACRARCPTPVARVPDRRPARPVRPGRRAVDSRAHRPSRDAHVERLEAAVERFNADLAPLKEFILPGGTRAAALAHVARTVCRRAERAVVALAASDDVGSQPARMYLNRLSDLLFVLARALNRAAGAAGRAVADAIATAGVRPAERTMARARIGRSQRRACRRCSPGSRWPTSARSTSSTGRPSSHLYAVALRIVREPAAAEEILQEAYVNVWHHAGTYDRGQEPAADLADVDRAQPLPRPASPARGRHRHADGRRRRRARVRSSVRTARRPSSCCWRAPRRGRCATASTRSTPARSRRSRWRSSRACRTRELAAHLREPLGTVKSWVRRGLERLKRCLDGAGYAPELTDDEPVPPRPPGTPRPARRRVRARHAAAARAPGAARPRSRATSASRRRRDDASGSSGSPSLAGARAGRHAAAARLGSASPRGCGLRRIAAPRRPPSAWWDRLGFWRALTAAGFAAALALGIALFAQRPDAGGSRSSSCSPVPDGKPALIASARARRPLPAGQGRRARRRSIRARCWSSGCCRRGSRRARSGVLPPGERGPRAARRRRPTSRLPNIPALAVSLEPAGGSPTGLPTGPVLYSGKIERMY